VNYVLDEALPSFDEALSRFDEALSRLTRRRFDEALSCFDEALSRFDEALSRFDEALVRFGAEFFADLVSCLFSPAASHQTAAVCITLYAAQRGRVIITAVAALSYRWVWHANSIPVRRRPTARGKTF
jgi:tetratricopeptide (TPR) repeat protein